MRPAPDRGGEECEVRRRDDPPAPQQQGGDDEIQGDWDGEDLAFELPREVIEVRDVDL